MKVLFVVLLSVLVISCGDEEDTLQVIEPPVNPEVEQKEPVQYEIPADIPKALAQHFAGLQEHMTAEEWHLVLDQVNKACNGSIRYINYRKLENTLSDEAMQALRKVRLLPTELNTDEGRIRAMGDILPDVHYAELEHNGTKVVHVKNAYTVILRFDGMVNHKGDGSGTGYSIHVSAGSNLIDDGRVEQITDKMTDAWHRQWREEFHPRFEAGEFQGKPVELRRSLANDDLRRVRNFFNNSFKIPHIPNDIDLLIIYIDEAGIPLNPDKAEGVWFDREDAPQATQEQLAEYYT